MQGRHRDAVRYGEDAIAETLDPATLGTVSDAYAALGDSARSGENARALEVAVSRQPGAYHRAWSLFLIDHDRRLPAVTQKIREELRTRQDVYGYDLLAWALHKQGKDIEALAAMRQALREGTVDAQLFHHAGMIERSLGYTSEAQAHLARARAVNPYFHAADSGSVRAVIAARD
jgi:tetratricopeptide (TPR) repeat protein